jgi:hypothetical protein
MVEYELMQASNDERKDVDVLAVKLVPILDEYWRARGSGYYGEQHWSVNPIMLVELWRSNSLILIMAFDGETTAGFMLGARMVSFFRPENVCSIEAYYGRTPEIEAGLLNFLDTAFKFFPEKTLILPVDDREVRGFAALKLSSKRTSNVYVR